MKKVICVLIGICIGTTTTISCSLGNANAVAETTGNKNIEIIYKEDINEYYSTKIVKIKEKDSGKEFLIYDGYEKGGITQIQ